MDIILKQFTRTDDDRTFVKNILEEPIGNHCLIAERQNFVLVRN